MVLVGILVKQGNFVTRGAVHVHLVRPCVQGNVYKRSSILPTVVDVERHAREPKFVSLESVSRVVQRH